MKTVLLSCFLLAIVSIGILLTPYEGFDTLTDKRTWISTLVPWQKEYIKNVASATPLQTQYNTLLTTDIALNRIDNLAKPPHNLTDAQIRSLYKSETATMNKDLALWASMSVATPTLPSPALTGLLGSASGSGPGSASASASGSGSGSSLAMPALRGLASGSGSGLAMPALTGLLASPSGSGPGLVAPPSNPIMQSAAANTISRSVEAKAEAEGQAETKSPSDWHRCPDMSKYIKKDEIPCWNCTL